MVHSSNLQLKTDAEMDAVPRQFESLIEVIRQHAKAQPERVALTFMREDSEDVLTNAGLQRRINAVSASLQETCVPGDRALLAYAPGLHFIAAFLGCLQAGVVAVPVYPPSKHARTFTGIAKIITDCQPKVMLTLSTLQPLLESHLAQAALAVNLVATDGLPDIAASIKTPTLAEQDLAFLQYTSGSTSDPKGVMISHGNLVNNLQQIRDQFQHDQHSRGVIWLPPYHDMGLIGGILQPLFVGFPVLLMAPMTFIQKPLRWLKAISDTKATTSGGPNFAYEACISKITAQDRQQLDLSHWNLAFNGAEPISAEILHRFAEVFAECGFRKEAFYPCYGMAENTLMVSGGKKGHFPHVLTVDSEAMRENRISLGAVGEASQELVSCGAAVSEHEVRIVDADSGRSLPADQVGEIWVTGPSVALGYWNQAEKTAAAFHAQLADTPGTAWMRTGDMGFFHQQQLYIAGRCKDLIIIRGRNYHPQDIEQSAEKSHPALKAGAGAAFSVRVDGEERLVVINEVRRDHLQADMQEVMQAMRKAVTENHELHVYAVVLLKPVGLPRTTSGKVRRFACQAGFLAGSLPSVAQWQMEFKQGDSAQRLLQRNSLSLVGAESSKAVIQRWLQEALAEQLHLEADAIELQTPFADYGMDSFQTATVSGELSDWLKQKISPSLFQDYPHIAAMSQYLALIYDLNHRLAELAPDEKRALLASLGDDNTIQDRFAFEAIPPQFHSFEQSDAYLAYSERSKALFSGKTRPPFFTVHEGLNNDRTVIDGADYINYSCNNFLGLSGHPRVTHAAVSAVQHFGSSVSASRLVSGERGVHLDLEREIADLVGCEDALVFVGAATANVSTVGHLFGENDLILYDELSHNSLLQGIKLSHADSQPFAHNDWLDLEKKLESMRCRYEKVLIFVEGLYSMDGDIPNLPKFIELKKRYKAWLMVDECLSIGVIGETGRGIGEHYQVDRDDVDIWMGGISKAFASCGGYVAGKRSLISYLKFTTPGFIYTTGLSPANAAAALEAIRILKEDVGRIRVLRERIAQFIQLAKENGLNTGTCHGAPIIPVIVGDVGLCMQLYQALFNRKINVQPIFYPAVAANASRLRFSLSATHTAEQISYTIATLVEVLNAIKQNAAVSH